jgi:hypothetical protein
LPVARRTALVYLVCAACLSALLFAWERGAYPNYAEGVYLFSARMILDGAVPYRDFIAAHPPLLFYAGTAVLGAWDSIDAIRVALAGAAVVSGGLVAVAVMRLTASSVAAVAAGVATILAPWTLHEHALLMPETFGAPLLMASAVLAARERTAMWAGLLAAVAVGFKWPFLLGGLAVAAAAPAPARLRYIAALAGGFAAGVLASFALFGAGRLYHQLVVAQQEVGWHTLHEVGGYAVQAVWNLVPLVVPAALGLWFARDRAGDALVRTLGALALAGLVLVGTVAKTGTYINTIALAEPPLVALAAAGLVGLFRVGAPRWAIAGALAAVALGAVEVASFVARPEDPRLFVRPLSARAHNWTGADAVDREVAAARRCPAGVAYSGQPYVAFIARRRMPGDEPDQFLMQNAPEASAAAAEAAAAEPVRCP